MIGGGGGGMISGGRVGVIGFTVVVVVAELFAEFESGVELKTVAVLVMIVLFGVFGLTCTASVKVAEPPTARLSVVQLMVPVAPTAGRVQDQVAGALSDTKVVLAGSVSVKVAAVAAGPLLVATIV